MSGSPEQVRILFGFEGADSLRNAVTTSSVDMPKTAGVASCSRGGTDGQSVRMRLGCARMRALNAGSRAVGNAGSLCRVRPLVGFSERVDCCGEHYSVLFARLGEFVGGARQPAGHFLEGTDHREMSLEIIADRDGPSMPRPASPSQNNKEEIACTRAFAPKLRCGSLHETSARLANFGRDLGPMRV
jgi:hypothetical protein